MTIAHHKKPIAHQKKPIARQKKSIAHQKKPTAHWKVHKKTPSSQEWDKKYPPTPK